MEAITFVMRSLYLVCMTTDNYFVVMFVWDVVNMDICFVLVIGFFTLEVLDHPAHKEGIGKL